MLSPGNSAEIAGNSAEICRHFSLTLLGQAFNNQFCRNWSTMMEFRRKPFLRATPENSAEILYL
jgi:hypothetical protein